MRKIDITSAKTVCVILRNNQKVLQVIVNGACVLRVGNIESFEAARENRTNIDVADARFKRRFLRSRRRSHEDIQTSDD